MSHRHVRICINGVKVRSTGGISAAKIKACDAIGRIPYDYVPELKAHQSGHVELTLVFIRRHHNASRRTITHISRYVFFNGWMFYRAEYPFGFSGLTLTAGNECYMNIHTMPDSVLHVLSTTNLSEFRTYNYFKYHSLLEKHSISACDTMRYALVPDFNHLYPSLAKCQLIGGVVQHEPNSVVQAERADHPDVQLMQPGKVSGAVDRPHDPDDGPAAC